ncbi:winged helix-turn-helix domain-containing protein [Dorea longicatena]|nr:helix-turn-helix domain-containing protein [Dorea longicatena]MCB5536838.1 helix-turn-helix domain-containing protein [bacterium MSK17_88]
MRPPKGAKCSQLRKKLKVDSRNWNYIRTVRGVGYKFQPLSGE